MLQAVEVLQLPTLELEAFLRDAFESNEALELVEPEGGEPHAAASDEPGSEPGPQEWSAETPVRRGTREDTQRHDALLRNQPAPERGLAASVMEQLALLDIDPLVEAWVRFLIDALDERGYLSLADDELLVRAAAAGLAGGAAELGVALAVLQSLEPRGIGGRDATEALLLQLDPRDPDYALLCRLLEDFLGDIASNKLPAVARALGLGALRELDPRPAAGLVGRTAPGLRPEVIVDWNGTSFEIRVDRSGLPEVRIDGEVKRLASDDEQPREVRRYLRGRLDQARWVVEAVEQRRATLLRVARTVFAHQVAFLEHGPGHLVPLRMSQVAGWLQLHVSTVSRAVSGKHVQTPWGIFPLRHFFQASAGSATDSARDDVREEVRRVVAAEDPARPLSDDEIVLEMGKRGLKLARRTVAKYRKELEIPSSYRRRRY
jgi:RNA polymerase sigma-54 factor